MTYTLAATFKISGNLKFLSHQETARLFQRALVRTFHDESVGRGEMKLSYSSGFNPRPRISLPLPRSVGLEGCSELLCVLIEMARESETNERYDTEWIKACLERRLPQGCSVTSVDLFEGRARFQPTSAVYEFEPARPEPLPEAQVEEIQVKAERLRNDEHIFIERRINERGDTREVDVGGYIESIEVNGLKIIVRCKITPSGTIRVDEMIKLLGVDESMIGGGVRRTGINWRTTTS